ncbi:hypothetical protein [Azohydromonas caseinilytica]|uniref:Uncharacterized protein n=1 Tax=Azohydromonas caseinilytica TaxID=2728836 RepID=A0A848FA75_9BURK|nr:hypothetical protein [Azohydromonas caseinilytica]NML15655.1 hypothetical protein [Azohydromonas caseinilytica]
MDLITGNAYDTDTRGTGWFLGFSDWTRHGPGELLHVPRQQALSGLCAKWFDHPAGHDSGDAKPVSEGRTVSILVSEGSAFRIEFSGRADFPEDTTEVVLLRRPGDFAAWGAGLYHRWHCLERSTVMSLRWNPA